MFDKMNKPLLREVRDDRKDYVSIPVFLHTAEQASHSLMLAHLLGCRQREQSIYTGIWPA